MNYGQFLNMIPEAFLVLILILVFFADFCLMKSERKNSVLSKMTIALFICRSYKSSQCDEDNPDIRNAYRRYHGSALA